jgi:hypothetical protein
VAIRPTWDDSRQPADGRTSVLLRYEPKPVAAPRTVDRWRAVASDRVAVSTPTVTLVVQLRPLGPRATLS